LHHGKQCAQVGGALQQAPHAHRLLAPSVQGLSHIPSHEAAARRALARVAGLEVHLASAALCGALHARLERGHAAAVAPRRRPGNLWLQPARTGQHTVREACREAWLRAQLAQRASAACARTAGGCTQAGTRSPSSAAPCVTGRRVPDACGGRGPPSDTGTPAAASGAPAEGQADARRAGGVGHQVTPAPRRQQATRLRKVRLMRVGPASGWGCTRSALGTCGPRRHGVG